MASLAKAVESGSNKDGRIEIFYIGLDDVLYHNWQLAPNGYWIGENPLGPSKPAKVNRLPSGRTKTDASKFSTSV